MKDNLWESKPLAVRQGRPVRALCDA